MIMEDFDRLEQLLQEGNFDALEEKDQLWIEQRLGGAESFSTLRETVGMAKKGRELPVKLRRKSDLIKHFRQQHQPKWKLALQWKVPAHAAALAIIVMAALVYLLIPAKERVVEKVVWQDPVVDTVFVSSKPDTVIIERTIEKPIYLTVYKTIPQENSNLKLAVERKPKGKSLADQADIKDILVSGR